MMFVWLVVAQFHILYADDHRYDCEDNFCRKFGPCAFEKCQEGYTLLPNATLCGCCHLCVKQLEKGASCRQKVIGVLPNEECGPGLICREQVCQSVDTPCIISGQNNCDEFGDYPPAICVQNQLCYCVNNDGQRIFGTDLVSKKNMKCDCIRDQLSFPRAVQEGDFPRCLPNGDYDPFQCTDDWCYCMGQSPAPAVPADGFLQDLPCYDAKRHAASKCWRERSRLQQQIIDFEFRRITVVGLDLPLCDPDGSYSPQQCKSDACFCVDADGEEYSNTRVQRHQGNTLNCGCLRDKDLLETIEKEKYTCKTFTV